MSVQDVLDEVDASRGAFYHYFDSKVALLDAVVERIVDQATAEIEPVATDPSSARQSGSRACSAASPAGRANGPTS